MKKEFKIETSIDNSFLAQSNKDHEKRVKKDKEEKEDFGHIIMLEKEMEHIKKFIADCNDEYEIEKANKKLAETKKEHDALFEEAQIKHDKKIINKNLKNMKIENNGLDGFEAKPGENNKIKTEINKLIKLRDDIKKNLESEKKQSESLGIKKGYYQQEQELRELNEKILKLEKLKPEEGLKGLSKEQIEELVENKIDAIMDVKKK